MFHKLLTGAMILLVFLFSETAFLVGMENMLVTPSKENSQKKIDDMYDELVAGNRTRFLELLRKKPDLMTRVWKGVFSENGKFHYTTCCGFV